MMLHPFVLQTDKELDSYLGLGNVTEQMESLGNVAASVHKRSTGGYDAYNMVELPEQVGTMGNCSE